MKTAHITNDILDIELTCIVRRNGREPSYRGELVLLLHLVSEFQSSCDFHALLNGEMWLKQIFLHDVRAQFVKQLQLTGLAVSLDSARDSRRPGGHTKQIEIGGLTPNFMSNLIRYNFFKQNNNLYIKFISRPSIFRVQPTLTEANFLITTVRINKS